MRELPEALGDNTVLVDQQVDQLVGGVRRHAATGSQLEVVEQLGRAHRETVSQIREPRLAHSREVHQDRKQPVQPVAGRCLWRRQRALECHSVIIGQARLRRGCLRRGCRGRRGHRCARRRAGGARRVRCSPRACEVFESADDGRTQVRRGEHLGRVAETHDPVDERALLGRDNPQAHDAGRLPGLHRPGTECGDHAPGKPRVHDHRHFHRGGLTTLGVIAAWTR